MALLQTYIHHDGNTADLDRYVFKNGRSLAQDCSIDLKTLKPGGEYGRAMNQWRKDCGKNNDRTAYHFVIAPDPKNHASLDQVRALATTWAATHFSDTQWFVGYHDDGGTGEIHAHVVVNAVGINRKKIRITKEEWAELANSAHRMAKDFGLFSDLQRVSRASQAKVEQTKQAEFRRMSEIKLKEQGAWSWKEDIRRTALVALAGCKNFEEFSLRLKEQGYRVEITSRGLTYHHPLHKEGSHQYSVKDYKLGALFTREGLVEKFTADSSEAFSSVNPIEERYRLPLDKNQRDRLLPKLDRALEPKPRFLNNLYSRGVSRGIQDVQKLANAIRFLREQGLTSARLISQEVERIEDLFDPLDKEWTQISQTIRSAEDILVHAYPLEWHTEIINEYESAPFFKRRSMQKQYPTELKEHFDAKEWCENKGLDPNTVIAEYEAKIAEVKDHGHDVARKINELEAYAEKLYTAVAAATRATAGNNLTDLARVKIGAHVKHYSIEDIEIVRSFSMAPNRRVPTGTFSRSFSDLRGEEQSRVQMWADKLAAAHKGSAITLEDIKAGRAHVPEIAQQSIKHGGAEDRDTAYSARNLLAKTNGQPRQERSRTVDTLLDRAQEKQGGMSLTQEPSPSQRPSR